MEQEYKRYVFNIDRRPSAKSFLIALPMNVYRIQTSKFESGLNFFQKTVLRFKIKPDISASRISELTGLDERLVIVVEGELKSKGLINSMGILTPDAKKILDDIDGLVVNTNQTQIGYVVQFTNSEDIYPKYLTSLGKETNMDNKKRIVVGNKGEGEEYFSEYYDFSKFDNGNIPTAPSEQVILGAITNCRQLGIIEDREMNYLGDSLSLRYLSEDTTFQKILVFTYVYLPFDEESQKFDSSWQVQDPFFPESYSPQIKFYIEELRDNSFNNIIEEEFGDAPTKQKELYRGMQIQKELLVEEKINKEYYLEFEKLPDIFKRRVKSLTLSYIDVEQSDFCNMDYVHSFLNIIQKSLETILKYDIKERSTIFNTLKRQYGDPRERKEKRNEAKRKERMRKTINSPENPWQIEDKVKLINRSDSIDPCNCHSLKHYLISLLMTYWYDQNSIMLKAFVGHVENVMNLGDIRNKEACHGSLEEDKPIPKEEVLSYYKTFNEIINNLIENNYV